MISTKRKKIRLGARAVGLVVVCAIAAGACASNPQPDLSSALIKRGEPSFSFDEPQQPQVVQPVKSESHGKPPALPAPRTRESTVPTVETTDRALKQALAELKHRESTENHRRAAAEYKRLRIFDKAFDHLAAALSLDPRCAEALAERAQVWRDSGFPELGLSDAYRAAFYERRSPEVLNTLGTLLQAVGDHDAARAAYLRVLAIDSHAAYAFNNLCYLSFLRGDQQQAIGECESALAEAPAMHAARSNLAMSLAASGRLEEADREVLRADAPAEMAFNVGMVYLVTGRYESAEWAFHRASSLRPNFVIAQKRARQAAELADTVRAHD